MFGLVKKDFAPGLAVFSVLFSVSAYASASFDNLKEVRGSGFESVGFYNYSKSISVGGLYSDQSNYDSYDYTDDSPDCFDLASKEATVACLSNSNVAVGELLATPKGISYLSDPESQGIGLKWEHFVDLLHEHVENMEPNEVHALILGSDMIMAHLDGRNEASYSPREIIEDKVKELLGNPDLEETEFAYYAGVALHKLDYLKLEGEGDPYAKPILENLTAVFKLDKELFEEGEWLINPNSFESEFPVPVNYMNLLCNSFSYWVDEKTSVLTEGYTFDRFLAGMALAEETDLSSFFHDPTGADNFSSCLDVVGRPLAAPKIWSTEQAVVAHALVQRFGDFSRNQKSSIRTLVPTVMARLKGSIIAMGGVTAALEAINGLVTRITAAGQVIIDVGGQVITVGGDAASALINAGIQVGQTIAMNIAATGQMVFQVGQKVVAFTVALVQQGGQLVFELVGSAVVIAGEVADRIINGVIKGTETIAVVIKEGGELIVQVGQTVIVGFYNSVVNAPELVIEMGEQFVEVSYQVAQRIIQSVIQGGEDLVVLMNDAGQLVIQVAGQVLTITNEVFYRGFDFARSAICKVNGSRIDRMDKLIFDLAKRRLKLQSDLDSTPRRKVAKRASLRAQRAAVSVRISSLNVRKYLLKRRWGRLNCGS